jgi:hypothetical protein
MFFRVKSMMPDTIVLKKNNERKMTLKIKLMDGL